MPLSAKTAACLGFFSVGLTNVGLRVGVRFVVMLLVESKRIVQRVVTELQLSCRNSCDVLIGRLFLVCKRFFHWTGMKVVRYKIS